MTFLIIHVYKWCRNVGYTVQVTFYDHVIKRWQKFIGYNRILVYYDDIAIILFHTFRHHSVIGHYYYTSLVICILSPQTYRMVDQTMAVAPVDTKRDIVPLELVLDALVLSAYPAIHVGNVVQMCTTRS